jgi:ribosome-binding protein aMBF1 (putative translation factor)
MAITLVTIDNSMHSDYNINMVAKRGEKMTIKEYRLQLGWSINELARRAGVAPRTVKRMEQGEAVYDYIAAQVAKALADATGQRITINDLDGLAII